MDSCRNLPVLFGRRQFRPHVLLPENIDAERTEWQAAIDEMTKLLSKKATERLIDKQLSESPDKMYAFLFLILMNSMMVK